MKNIAFAFPMHYRTIALATIVALLAWTLGLPAMIHNANAATLEYFSDTISDSDINVDAVHTITFTTVNAMTSEQGFRIYFDEDGSNFDFTDVTAGDLVSANSSGFTPVEACTGGLSDEIELSVGANFIEGQICTGDTVPAGEITIVLDGANRIANPGVVGSYVISLQGHGTTPILDSGDTRVAIIDDVTVTADVDTIFEFTIVGVDEDITVNDDATVTSGSTTATAIPFGTIAPETALLLAQELRVNTNALNGFSVSVFADQTLTSGNGATIDAFIEAGYTSSSTQWVGPTDILGDTDTYGHWGLTSDDDVVSSTTPNLWGTGEALYVGNFIQNPVEVFYHNLPVTYAQGGVGVGHTKVAYKVEIGYLQEAAKDYTATLTYIATPVF